MSVKYTTPAQHKSNLDRIGSGQASYQQVVNELRAKYAKKG